MKRKMFISSLVSVMMCSQIANVSVFANANEVYDVQETQVQEIQVQEENAIEDEFYDIQEENVIADEFYEVQEIQVQEENAIAIASQNESIINSIKIAGIGIGSNGTFYGNTGFTINFNKDENKIKISNVKFGTNRIHNNFGGNEYLKFELYGRNKELKHSVRLTGNDRTNKIMNINGVNFEYGDYVKIYHAEGEQNRRYNLAGNVIDKKDGLKDYTYRITKDGLQQIFKVKNKIQMRGIGYRGSKYQGFDIVFNTVDKKIKIANMLVPNSRIHAYFGNNPYMKMNLYGADGTQKKSVVLRGNDPASIARKLDNQSFEYGDIIEIFHAEGDFGAHRYNVTEIDMRNKGNIYKYEITKNGLRLISVSK